MTRNPFGYTGMLFGAASLLFVIVHFWAGPIEPQKTIERTIAETAVSISKEVVNVIRKKPAVLQERHWNHDDLVRIAGAGLAALALVLAAIGFVRREDHRPVIVGAGLGGGAIAFGFVTWLALVAAGLVIIWIVVANLGGILGAGGLGGGVRAFYRYRPPSHAVSAP